MLVHIYFSHIAFCVHFTLSSKKWKSVPS